MTVFTASVGLYTPAGLCFNTSAADSDGGQRSCGKKKNKKNMWAWTVGVCLRDRAHWFPCGWMNRSNAFLLFLLNSPGIREGQGQSNSYQLFWFFSEIVGQVGAGLILISETNGRGLRRELLREKCDSFKEQLEKKARQKKKKKQRRKRNSKY